MRRCSFRMLYAQKETFICLIKKKTVHLHGYFENSAESEGFEPPKPFGSTVFKTAAIDHSANFPFLRAAKLYKINDIRKKK